MRGNFGAGLGAVFKNRNKHPRADHPEYERIGLSASEISGCFANVNRD